jgi:hypothetical protein
MRIHTLDKSWGFGFKTQFLPLILFQAVQILKMGSNWVLAALSRLLEVGTGHFLFRQPNDSIVDFKFPVPVA